MSAEHEPSVVGGHAAVVQLEVPGQRGDGETAVRVVRTGSETVPDRVWLRNDFVGSHRAVALADEMLKVRVRTSLGQEVSQTVVKI